MASRSGKRILGTLLAGLCLLAGNAAPAAAPSPDEVRWLNRITYGIDTATLARYQQLGCKAFLAEQLRPTGREPGPDLAAAISAIGAGGKPLEQVLAETEAENKRIQGLPDEDARQAARQAMNQAANQAANAAARRHLIRALASPAQLQEQMVWFWMNHFNVFQGKGNLRWTVADYEEQAIRPHALGRFQDLVRATLTHPAMLVYLDNTQSAGGRTNENYARELLELHTLGLEGGYTQQDVQELARVLTGAGVAGTRPPALKPDLRPFHVRAGAFEFNPARHDFGDKVVLGERIPGRGWPEVEQVVALLAEHPATARFVSRKLAAYWLGTEPPESLVAAMARTFQHSHGDIPAVLDTLFASRAFADSLGRGFRDPMHYLAAVLRLAYDGKRPLNLKPVINWLNALGEPLYGHGTPDGYPVAAQAWSSPGQLARRFEIARNLGSGNAGLFDGDDGQPGPVTGFPQLASRLYYEAVAPTLSPATRQALDRAGSQQEWNTFLLASPEFMAR